MSLEQAIQEARQAINRDLIPARLGNGTGTVYDLTTPGNYYLRKLEADGKLSQPFSLPVNPLANIPVKDGLPVDIGYDLRGVQCIWQANTASMLSANTNPYIVNPLDTAVYGKTSQTNLATLYCQRHADTVNFPFTVVVFPAPLIINGVAKFFAGGAIDLSSFVPSTGLHNYATVFITTDMTLEAFASTPTNLLDPLTVDVDIAECIAQSSADSVVDWAWELRDTDTSLSPDPTRNVDMRQIVNTGSGSGSVTFYQTVEDNGSPLTQRANLNFIGATLADNPGNDSTDVTVTGGGGGTAEVLLDFTLASDIFNGTAISANTWTDCCSNQNFTVSDATKTIMFYVSGVINVNSISNLMATRLIIDSGGTPITISLGGSYVSAANFINALAGTGAAEVTAMSAATHTVKVQLETNASGTAYLRASSVPDFENLRIVVVQLG